MIDISVIIPVYNASLLIRRCLDSILAQEGGYSYEILLIDDGSTDDSVSVIESYNNPCFKVFRQQNAGPAAARNRGLKEAKGKYLCYIDADDYWENHFFEKTINFLEKHHECIAITVGQKHLTVSGEYMAPDCIDNYHQPIVLDDFFSFWAEWMHVCTGSIMIRTEYAQKVGGQRTELRITEDLEFWALLATFGKFGFIPEVLFTSDGIDLVQSNRDWLRKMQIRWMNAPTIDNWEHRIITSMPTLTNNIGYMKARGRISRNLTYCQLLSGRIALARQEAKRYGKYFPNDGIGRLMNLMKGTAWSWWILCKFLRYREYHRF